MMKSHRTHPRLRRRRVSFLATFILVLAVASGGVAMAATSYVRTLRAANQTAPHSTTATITVAPGCWQPPGCVFPATTSFAGR